MRWIYLMLCCVIATIAVADPDPKKYKSDGDKKSETLTNEEKKFLREVEEKFGVKSEVPVDDKKESDSKSDIKNVNITELSEKKLTFPAVIAIEIVNDTDSKGKGKRTIDANLGYGYETNNGYTYNYFGKSSQDKGKFMIYPYSQEDIPSRQNIYNSDYVQSSGNYQKTNTNVEIQPSQAFELVPVKEQQTSYEYKKPEVEFKTPSPPTFGSEPSSTLFTTYNGQEFSGLSAQFPTVMPNYFVNPSQLLRNPQYQSAGLTQDHLRSHESQLGQRIVPVLVLRIPSSSIKNPSAELYANLPNNYPLSSYLNNVNLQQLVNQYFKKHGYSFAPQIMAYQSPSLSPVENDPHYAQTLKPSYSQSDYPGVQYSVVKPVMARYPSSYNQQTYVSQLQSQYAQPPQQRYEYQSQQVPQTNAQPVSYYVQSQYEEPSSAPEYSHGQSSIDQRTNIHESDSVVEHKIPEQANQEYSAESYDSHQAIQQSVVQPSSYYTTADTASSYEVENDNTKEQPTYDPNTYSSGSNNQNAQVYPSRLIHTENYEESNANSGQEYNTYQSQLAENHSPRGFTLSENYPSKEHTIATVFPNSYSAAQNPKQSIQSVTYVTPMPSAKYQSQYRIMVPQTVFKPTSDKVTYVKSNTMNYNHAGRYTQDVESEEEYNGSQYVPPVASRPSYPRNYRSHPKRMAKPDNKAAASIKVVKKIERSEKKSS